jgi:hypothetical protein
VASPVRDLEGGEFFAAVVDRLTNCVAVRALHLSMYYGCSQGLLVGKKQLAGDATRAATSDEVKDHRREARALKGSWPISRSKSRRGRGRAFHDLVMEPAFGRWVPV